ncbi:hypothetical protein, partial [Vibrio parahaemolyticus]|uniref:hypothetical protein n=1 Tax=Vibrio parahaemolyticus TaxID=670 RepID=UPI001E41BD12
VCIFSRSYAQFEIINVYLLKSNFHTYLFLQAPNAALRGEQRKPPKLNHCAVNTKANSNQNCQAL